MPFITRIQNFLYRSKWLGEIVGGPFVGAFYWIKARFFPYLTMKGRRFDIPFFFRGVDLPIVREVIHEREYETVLDSLEGVENPVVIDVGAHIGLFALSVFGRYPGAHVTSVEASHKTFNLVKKNHALAIQYDWTVLKRAGWSSDDFITFDSRSISMSNKVASNGNEEIQGITLSQLVLEAKQETVDLLKVDIEGAEEAFLLEKSVDLGSVRSIVIELHKECCDTQRVEEFLSSIYPKIQFLTERYSSRPVLFCHH